MVLGHLKTSTPFPEEFVWFIPDFWRICFGDLKCFTPTDALDLWHAAVLAKRVAIQFMTWGDREIWNSKRRPWHAVRKVKMSSPQCLASVDRRIQEL
jgi:hypothetical protein